MFSTVGTTHTRFSARPSRTAAMNAPITPAAPPMSNFISSMPGPGLRLMPPESKVTPLPTSAYGFSSALPPRYCSTTSLGLLTEPRATASSEPKPSLSISTWSSTWQLTRSSWASANACAWAAIHAGLQMFGGRLASSRAKRTPSAIASACARPACASSPAASVTRASSGGLGFLSRGLKVAV